jgi:hypothetical protein
MRGEVLIQTPLLKNVAWCCWMLLLELGVCCCEPCCNCGCCARDKSVIIAFGECISPPLPEPLPWVEGETDAAAALRSKISWTSGTLDSWAGEGSEPSGVAPDPFVEECCFLRTGRSHARRGVCWPLAEAGGAPTSGTPETATQSVSGGA